MTIPAALAAMAAYPQWILWKPVKLADGKVNKLPVNPLTLEMASSTDSSTWCDAEIAYAAAVANPGLGVGFVFTSDDPFIFVDIDHCLDGGAWSPFANELLTAFNGCAIEVSQSGEGIHIFGRAAVPLNHRNKNKTLGLEVYTTGRFVALSGNDIVGNSSLDCSATANWLLQTHLPGESVAAKPSDWTTWASSDWDGYEDDEELITAMLKSRSAAVVFGTRCPIEALWSGNEDVLAKFYPDDVRQDGLGYGASEADAALLSHLSFWTGRNSERMLRLMRRSVLGERDRWQEGFREDYQIRSINNANGICTEVFKKRTAAKPMPIPSPVMPAVVPALAATVPVAVAVAPVASVLVQSSSSPVVREGYQFLGVAEQLEYFKGCVYVRDAHRVFTPDGSLLKPDQFKAAYGGYVFTIDADGGTTTRNAYEAFIDSQALTNIKVHSTCFRPELPPGLIVNEEGRSLVNTYVPAPIRMIQGDPEPFLDYLRKLLPIREDRLILASYMAACVQYPGVKFQWCPLLQGVEGNGKSLIMRVVAEAVGNRYTHFPNAQDLGGNGSKFNGWIYGKLFIGIEEIHVSGRREVADALKPLITNSRIEIQGKGADQVTGDNRANFIMNSNHKDAVMKTKNDRRYAVFFTAQQREEDLRRDGMDGLYFPNLYRWLGQQDGYAIVAYWLNAFIIPAQYDPSGECHRAPQTSSTDDAISASLGSIEQEILEAINEGRMGFNDGWISSMALDRLLQQLHAGRMLPQNKRRDVLDNMGYVPHPALHGGRCTRHVGIDGGKPRLYVYKDHVAATITDGRMAMETYERSQTEVNLLPPVTTVLPVVPVVIN